MSAWASKHSPCTRPTPFALNLCSLRNLLMISGLLRGNTLIGHYTQLFCLQTITPLAGPPRLDNQHVGIVSSSHPTSLSADSHCCIPTLIHSMYPDGIEDMSLHRSVLALDLWFLRESPTGALSPENPGWSAGWPPQVVTQNHCLLFLAKQCYDSHIWDNLGMTVMRVNCETKIAGIPLTQPECKHKPGVLFRVYVQG